MKTEKQLNGFANDGKTSKLEYLRITGLLLLVVALLGIIIDIS